MTNKLLPRLRPSTAPVRRFRFMSTARDTSPSPRCRQTGLLHQWCYGSSVRIAANRLQGVDLPVMRGHLAVDPGEHQDAQDERRATRRSIAVRPNSRGHRPHSVRCERISGSLAMAWRASANLNLSSSVMAFECSDYPHRGQLKLPDNLRFCARALVFLKQAGAPIP
ncbi:hypothetical protein [Sphingomonas sp.]|uniref:hypothetical protein n=1 Tax=Sphingomonas sp. TaxID=28214 RepID=UPI0025CC71EF|nr:hypothetical protein [Sphingomonas sp.]